MVTSSISQAIMENKAAYESYLATLSYVKYSELSSDEISSLFTEPVHPNAVDLVVQAKIKYAIKLAWKMFPYAKWRIDINDLISAANYGLQQAALHFDPGKGTFNSYAYLWIRKAIYDFAAKNHVVSRSYKAAASFKKEDCMAVEIEHCEDELHTDSGEEQTQARLICEKLMEHFSPKQREYITSYFLEGKNICDIAKEKGVTHQAISHSIQNGLRKAREILSNDRSLIN